ncbi:MAG TPA: hypothetical protein VKA62_04730, partial [Agromyces sp.]|nr:hypothetical protein [Agromyces sp.]
MRRRKSSGGTIGIAAIAIGLVVTTIALVAGATAAITVRFARKVVTPPRKREEDVRILRIDLAGEEITLAASDESRMAGRYG